MNVWRKIVNAVMRRNPGEQRVFIPSRQGGIYVSEDSALTHSAVWACVRVISETVASLPWHVYRRDGNNSREPIDHNVQWLLNHRPNAEMTAFSFREALIAHALTWGNGYAELERDLVGRVVGLNLLTPDRVTAQRDTEGALRYSVLDDLGRESHLAPSQIFHLHGLGYDGLVGYSPVRMAARSIGLGIAQDSFAQAFYSNGTSFGGIVEVPTGLTPQQIAEMEIHLNSQHQGPNKAFKIRIAAAGMKYHSTTMPMTDAQFLESRRFSATEVARWFRVPPHKIADLERSTNNNIEHQAIEFVTDTIVPWAQRMEQEANVKLFGARALGSTYTKLNVNALMRGDAVSRANYYRTMTQMGAMSINEVRSLEELNDIGPVGDSHLVQLNQTTVERLVNGDPQADPQADAQPIEPSDAAGDAGDDAPPANESPANIIRMGGLTFTRGTQEQKV